MQVTVLQPPSGQSADYVPTLTPILNINTVTLRAARYFFYGTQVNVSLCLSITPTAAGLFQVDISPPLPSAFTGTDDVIGVGGASNESQPGVLSRSGSNMTFVVVASGNQNRIWRIVGNYVVRP